jgi:putative PIN family toxin of toxin-antitoxin system
MCGIDKTHGIIYDTNMVSPKIVIDSNVLIAALRSRRGASYKLLMLIDSGKFEVYISVSLALEYEDATKRLIGEIPLAPRDLDDILHYLCKVAGHQKIHYLWRPFLSDPGDDMVLELAVASGADFIVTHNQRDFGGIEQFGVEAITPKEFLIRIGVLP